MLVLCSTLAAVIGGVVVFFAILIIAIIRLAVFAVTGTAFVVSIVCGLSLLMDGWHPGWWASRMFVPCVIAALCGALLIELSRYAATETFKPAPPPPRRAW